MKFETHPSRSTRAEALGDAFADVREAIRLLRGVSSFLGEAHDNADRMRAAAQHAQRAALGLDALGLAWIGDVERLVHLPEPLPPPWTTLGQVWAARRALETLDTVLAAIADEHARESGAGVRRLEPLAREDLARPLAEAGLLAALVAVFAAIGGILAGFVAPGIALAVAALVVLGLVGRSLA